MLLKAFKSHLNFVRHFGTILDIMTSKKIKTALEEDTRYVPSVFTHNFILPHNFIMIYTYTIIDSIEAKLT